MNPNDPLADHWIRVGVAFDDGMLANAIFAPGSTVTVGPSEQDTIQVSSAVLPNSFTVLSDGTRVHTCPGMELRLREIEGVRVTTAEAVGAMFCTHAHAMNLRLSSRLAIFVHYVPTRADAERLRAATDQHVRDATPERVRTSE
jgi:hypothetical protein